MTTILEALKEAEAKATRGPWRVVIDDSGNTVTTGFPSVVAPDDLDAAIIHWAGFKQKYWGDWSAREANANANLIALSRTHLRLLIEAAEALRKAVQLFGLRGFEFEEIEIDGEMIDPYDLKAEVTGALAKLQAPLP